MGGCPERAGKTKSPQPAFKGLCWMAVVLGAAHCKDPTEITLELRTDVSFEAERKVVISAGARPEPTEPIAVTEKAWGADGDIGTFVLTPTENKTAQVRVRVVVGVAQDALACSIDAPQGCIFARRKLSFIKHASLRLPIRLYANCQGIMCNEDETCNALGTCVSAEVDPDSCDSPLGCRPPEDPGPSFAGDASTDSGAVKPDGGDAGSPEADAAPGLRPEAGPDGATGPVGPSCAGGLDCGGLSCCDSELVPGGTFLMGRDTGTDACPSGKKCDDDDEKPEHNATVSTFYLDTFEVTVGRFRKFVQAYDGKPPVVGAGDHHELGAGWQSGWNANMAATQAALKDKVKCSYSWTHETWTDTTGEYESKPLNCVSWYEAFAFCVWDGGRLPTEAEWEYAAAGGPKNRLYPWGSDDPNVDKARANTGYSEASPYIDVGSHPTGNGYWGHRDLAGSMWEWTFDGYDGNWYNGAGKVCVDCANSTATTTDRATRGGSFFYDDRALRAADRFHYPPTVRQTYVGFRCARKP